MREVRVTELRRRLLLVGSVAAAVVLVDHLTKLVAARVFVTSPLVVIPNVLTFVFTENRGASFSLFQGGGTFLALAALVAVGIVVASAWTPRPLGELIGFGLIGGGAVGNLIDRLARGPGLFDGPVIDWIQFPHFPVFNIADAAINIGVAVLLVVAWRHR